MGPHPDEVATYRPPMPRPIDLFQADNALRHELQRRLPAEVYQSVLPRLERMGALTAGPLWELMQQAEAEPPRLQSYGIDGARIDRLHTSPAWKELQAISAREGLVAIAYDPALGSHARLVQAALIHLFSASSAIFSCPLAMTDAAARVLSDLGEPALRDRVVPALLTTDPALFTTSGQWMTERPGGSDVGASETLALPLDESGERYALTGVKWFTSAADGGMALTLARIVDARGQTVPGSRGLSMFLVEVPRDAQGHLRPVAPGAEGGIRIRRLKDKLGTKALPTAELELHGIAATRIGPVGRGVPSISGMLNITRYWNAASSSSAMAQAALWADDFAARRQAFGRPIADHPAHARVLRELRAEAAGAFALVAELATLLGRVEHRQASDEDARCLRALLPIAKLLTGKQAVAVTSEALECFGGLGYIEDSGLPRMLRDAQTLPIWEGTTNVLSLDLLRAEQSEGGLTALLTVLGRRLDALSGAVGAELQKVQELYANLCGRLGELIRQADRPALEWEARRLAMTTGLLWEATLLAEAAAESGDPAASERFEDFVRAKLGGPLG